MSTHLEHNGRRKESKVIRGKVALAAAATACLVGASGATARPYDAPARPAHDIPSAGALTVGIAAPTDSSLPTEGQGPLASLQSWIASKWGALGGGVPSFAGGPTMPVGYAQPLGSAAPGAIGAKTLVLYDTTNSFGWLGELYAEYAGNLVSHFGTWKAEPVSQYTAGQIGQYTATIYIGSTYNEPLPASFLSDVATATRPVIWIYDNIWELSNQLGWNSFLSQYGWEWAGFDTSPISHVLYNGQLLSRDGTDNGGGIMTYANLDTTKATPLAWAVRDGDGSQFPWALKSGNLIYFGENPFVYTSETDRVLAFDAILQSVLDPFAQTRHRALIRLEDLSPNDDPATVMQIAQWLYDNHIPYGFGFSPDYVDPNGYFNNGTPVNIPLSSRQGQAMNAVVHYMQSHGGTLVMHGYTHQYRNIPNPYTAVTDDDFEFYRTTQSLNSDGSTLTLNFQGPVPEDSFAWAANRILASFNEFRKAKDVAPTIFEFPHYMASQPDYKAAAALFKTRWERALYFNGSLDPTATPDYSHVIGQFFPWVVRDVYGSTVLPENVGNYEPQPFYQFPIHTIQDVVNAAKAESVIKDGMIGAYYHNFWGLQPLVDMVNGLKAAGYTFVDPSQVAVTG